MEELIFPLESSAHAGSIVDHRLDEIYLMRSEFRFEKRNLFKRRTVKHGRFNGIRKYVINYA
jgi:hypothetical protein